MHNQRQAFGTLARGYLACHPMQNVHTWQGAHRWNHVLVELPGCEDIHQRAFPSILKANQRKFHFLPKE